MQALPYLSDDRAILHGDDAMLMSPPRAKGIEMYNSISWLSIAKLWLAINGNGERRTFYTTEGAEQWLALWNNRTLI